jgi:hypothetical protein
LEAQRRKKNLKGDWKHSGTQVIATTTSSAAVPSSGAVSVAHTDALEEEQDEVKMMLVRSQGAFEGKLTVTVERINIPYTGGWMERADPFVKLTLGHETMRTSVKKNAGGNVIYRETCTFNKQLTHGKLRVAVMDKDTLVDDIQGECTIDLHQMHIDGGFNRTEPSPFQVQIFQHCNKKKRNVVAVTSASYYAPAGFSRAAPKAPEQLRLALPNSSPLPLLPSLSDQLMHDGKAAGFVYLHISKTAHILKTFRALVWRAVTLTNNSSIIADIAMSRKKRAQAMQNAAASGANESARSHSLSSPQPFFKSSLRIDFIC